MLGDVNGDIRGETVNGGLRVELANEKWDGPGLDLKTVNGGVTLAVPTGFSGELDARTANGGISVDFPITITGLLNNRRQISGTLGSGGAQDPALRGQRRDLDLAQMSRVRRSRVKRLMARP